MKPPFGIRVASWGGLELPPETSAAGWTADPDGYAARRFRDPMGRFLQIRRDLAERVLWIIKERAPVRSEWVADVENRYGGSVPILMKESTEAFAARTAAWLETAEMPPQVGQLCMEWHHRMVGEGYLPPRRTP